MIFKVSGVSGDTKIREKLIKNETLGPEETLRDVQELPGEAREPPREAQETP